MEFDEIVVKESPGLCRCCLSEGCYKDMGTEYTWMNENEVYADMLLECFDIGVSQQNEGPNGPNRLICEVCITRLRDACNFKKQVLDSEKKFIDMIGRGEFRSKVLICPSQMKSETEDAAVDDVEYLVEDDMVFCDDEPLKPPEEPSISDITVSSLRVKNKRGRPKKADVKTEKKAKVAKLEEKAKSSKSIVKGDKGSEAASKSSISSTKRNRLMKRNAITVLESSTAVPFKWHRQNYLCFFCHMPFKDPELLKEHTKHEHEKANIKTAVAYLRRDEKVKIDVTELFCKQCELNARDLHQFIDHVKVVHKLCFAEEYGHGLIPYKLRKDDFQCAICEENFHYFIKLNQHMNEHYGDYICDICGKSFLSQDRLRCHSMSHGAGFKCASCAEVFDSLTRKNDHDVKVHNKDKKVKCCYCTETFSSYMQRKKHHASTHNVVTAEFKCPVCGKVFQIMSKMKVHLKEVHMREKKFSCTLCDQKFFSKTHVQKHMVKHSGERVHHCDVCMKSYARKQTLRDHMRIHDNDRRFVCALCSQSFVQSNGLRLHLRVHHPGPVSAQI